MKLKHQSIFGFVLLLVAGLVLTYLYCRFKHSLSDHQLISGWSMAAVFVMLTAFNVKKKLSFLPLGFSRHWTQFHIYVGLLSGYLFLIHIDFRLPNGPLEILLTVLFAFIFLSGLVGLIMTKVFPGRLSVRGEEVVFERIPIYARQIRKEAESIALDSVSESKSSILAEFYEKELSDYFSAPQYLLSHLVESQKPLTRLLYVTTERIRYGNEKEKQRLNRLKELIRRKYDLDYHFSLQGALKLWFFVHLPLAYASIVFVVLHVILIYAFRGALV